MTLSYYRKTQHNHIGGPGQRLRRHVWRAGAGREDAGGGFELHQWHLPERPGSAPGPTTAQRRLYRRHGSIFKFLDGDNIDPSTTRPSYTLTIADGLTGINKRFFLEYPSEMGRSSRYQRTLTLMMFDIDHFKQINDVHGHWSGS